jgi:hypothetical protein
MVRRTKDPSICPPFRASVPSASPCRASASGENDSPRRAGAVERPGSSYICTTSNNNDRIAHISLFRGGFT